ncbi:hypothetical protein BBO99_00002614 [Phytophthora kernoviae]|uniref:Micro-fibrillar-associated protein 1 C-terminal domain-containing protein n=2 Tax=Phytophthora kernoviae TaxID=325452 RepID=A0A3R7KM76_9STRA|nr:hypothetical protein G195_006307 [Phytophthora kernoviae 00238/432]KAG2525325.1 hypothetical protein JM18_004969 [Phytophthora kernoviae]KAG2529189.1 hypothetical protein JM16_002117 [Phytophthora kernoviae]RLN21554.1 hypothetical protein BBI17_002545 [Phytophthora kernoviae]RLN82843.1 hypothetical protein BBO99_00002614 [Phytophthora kernoviae]
MSLFTKKDLGLLLPDDTPGDPVSLRHTQTKEATEVFEPLKPKVDPSKKVTRYRAGHVPHFAHGYEEDRGFVTANSQPVEPQIVKRGAVTTPAAKSAADSLQSNSSSSSSSSEYETDTDESEPGEELMKPVFVPKKARGTVKGQKELDAEEERRQKREEEKINARKMESRRLVAEEIQRDLDVDKAGDSTDVEMPDDTDGLDPAQEYRDWELREMRRIKRDRDRKEQRRKEAEETQRRRNMTEEERTAEDAKLKKNEPKEKKKLKFMQKYYHKGAFYVDDDSIHTKDDVRNREATEATLEDKFNREMLPTVMQVKNFGRAGRTKYTHLADQDTSGRDSLWGRKDGIREKYKSHLGGMKDIDGSTKRRRKE